MNPKSMSGWIVFAGILMLIAGVMAMFEGLIALMEDEYFVPSQSGFLVLDLTGWGWAMLIWGAIVIVASIGLLAAKTWARWFAVVVIGLNFLAQLGFLGNTQYPVWSLTMVAQNIIVLFALTARWDESKDGLTNR